MPEYIFTVLAQQSPSAGSDDPSKWLLQLSQWTGLPPYILVGLAQSLAIIIAILIVRWTVMRIVRKRVTDMTRNYHLRRTINYSSGILLLILVGMMWIEGLGNIGTFLGLVSAGVAIALQDPLTNLAGWAFIMTRRPFKVGDRIEIGQFRGDVIDIRLFQVFMLECGNWVQADQSTGRIVMVPNRFVFNHQVASYTRGFDHIWDEIPVLVTFESDWKRAKHILTEIANEYAQSLSAGAQEQIRQAARSYLIYYSNLTPIVYTDVRDSGVMLTIRYLTLPRRRRGSAQQIWEAILERFAEEPNVDLAYPTTRMYRNELEGKPAMRATPDDKPVTPDTDD